MSRAPIQSYALGPFEPAERHSDDLVDGRLARDFARALAGLARQLSEDVAAPLDLFANELRIGSDTIVTRLPFELLCDHRNGRKWCRELVRGPGGERRHGGDALAVRRTLLRAGELRVTFGERAGDAVDEVHDERRGA